jgi:hypothetical protein
MLESRPIAPSLRPLPATSGAGEVVVMNTVLQAEGEPAAFIAG